MQTDGAEWRSGSSTVFHLKIICASNPFVKTGMSDKCSCLSGSPVLKGASREPQFGRVCSAVRHRQQRQVSVSAVHKSQITIHKSQITLSLLKLREVVTSARKGGLHTDNALCLFYSN
jgi:hypothetical protein